MSDGHSGVENKQVNQGGSGGFRLILAYLKHGTGEAEFVIHATSNIYAISSGLQPRDFLVDIGFTHYSGHCLFHYDECYYRVIATLQQDFRGHEHFDQVQLLHGGFDAFARRIDELFQLRQKEYQILRSIGVKASQRRVLGPPISIKITEQDVPLWVNEVKFRQLCQLEEQKATIQEEIDKLTGFLPLLFGTGNVLEEAVLSTLDFFGLEAERTQKGFTADILAQTPDGSRKFGLEVTGISGPVKKDSNKLTQVLDFERIKEHGEKTILVANTHNTRPIPERATLEHFTPQVLDFLGRHPILLLTGWDLYCMVRSVLEGSRTREEIIEILYSTNGELKLDSLPSDG